jgi:hypothetical protein
MSQKNLVTQDELKATIASLNALADNLNEHVNQSLSKAHGWSILDTAYLDSGGIYQTDFGQTGFTSIPGVYNTGVNNDGTLAAPGSVDQHWTLILSPDPSFPGPNAFIASPKKSSWSSDGPISQWISPAADATKNRKGGSYKYRLSFNLSGLNPASALVKGSWVSDNNTTAVILNGITTGITGPSNSGSQPSNGSQFQFTTGFVAGVNTLDFIVSNGGGSPTGFRCEITGVASSGGVLAVPTVYGTGQNADRTLAAFGSIDQHWTLIQSPSVLNPGPNTYVMNPIDGSWTPNTTTSRWIGALPNGNQSPGLGTYAYRQSFDLTGFSPGSTIIKGSFSVDDSVTQVLLNGVKINNFPVGKKNAATSFVIASGFSNGINTIDFYVKNTVTHTGLKVDMSATATSAGTGLTARVLRLTIGGNVFYVPCQGSGGVDGTADPTIPTFTGIISPQSADPASDLTVGSPTPSKLITTFAEQLIAIANAASDTLLQHAGSQPEDAHGGLSWQNDSVVNTAGNLVGRRTINILINGVQYKIVGDFALNGPLP